MKGLVIAGAQSGSGKTTLSLGLMAAFKARGLRVQAFKAGPDFIDPGHHALVTGRPSHNLDGWMLSREENLAVFRRYAAGADLAVVEGVMGLYDGFSPEGESGSTAEMAKWLGLPVLLTVSAKSMARSLAALVQGYARFDPGLTWAGLAANQTGSPRHVEILARAMEQVPELPFLGGLPRRPDLALPERHLGLITAEEGGFGAEGAARLAAWVEQALDLDALLERLPGLSVAPPAAAPLPAEPRIRLGVARDRAFCFYYQENLRRLEEAGAELVFFSPLEDAALPPGLDGLYLGGGYPELFAARLSANRALCEEIAAQGRAGLPIYAECGGMIYLARRLTDLEGVDRPMAGLLPLDAVMLPRLRSLGYRQVTLAQDSPLGPAGAQMRGHEFHYSELSRAVIEPPHSDRVYRVRGSRGGQPEVKGFRVYNTLASYVHLHFGSRPDLAPDFVDFCRAKTRAAAGRRAPSGPGEKA